MVASSFVQGDKCTKVKKSADAKAFGCSSVVKRHLTAGLKGDFFGNGRP